MVTPLPAIPMVSLVEDNPGIRENIATLLREAGDQVCFRHSYATAEEALARLPAEPPDIVLMDINLPGKNGIECVRQLKAAFPKMQFLMLTVYDDSESVFQSLVAGASGYLIKRAAPEQLVQAILDVHCGGAPMSATIARKVVQYFHQLQPARPNAELSALTSREEEVLQLLAKGKLRKEIAFELGITMDTVSKHLQKIYTKLHVSSRTEAVVKFLNR